MAENQVDVADVLGSIKLFSDLSRPELEAAAHTLEEQVFPQEQRILRQGFSGSSFYLVIEGEASVKVDGRDLAKLGRGDFFGEVSILLGEAPTADVVALTPLRCLVLPASMLQDFLESNPKVMFRMLQTVATRLRNTLKWQN